MKLNFKWQWWKKRDQIDAESFDHLLKVHFAENNFSREDALSLPAVASSVDLICGTIGMIPIKLYQQVDGKKIEVENDSRVKLLNKDTKSTLDAVQFKRALVEDYLLDKGGYALIKKKRNTIDSLVYIKPKEVTIVTNADNTDPKISFMIDANEYKQCDVLTILKNTKDGGSGVGVVNQVSKALETSFRTLLYQLNLVKSGGNKRGFLTSENPLSKEAFDKLKNAWKELYTTNENNVIILNKGLNFKECSNSSVEMQLKESRETLNNEICNIFHIRDKYSDTLKEAIMPIISAIECALNRVLLLEKEKDSYFFAFDLKEVLKADLKERFEAYKIAKETGWITLNEIRYLENKDTIEGLDVIAMSLGNVIYNTKTQEYFVPNTDSNKSFEGGDENE